MSQRGIEIDYSSEVKLHKSVFYQRLFIVLGTVFFVLAIIGIFLPLLPTTPFLLLSASCYAKGSVRFYNWLMNHRVFGQYIRDWSSGKGVSLKNKVMAISLMAVCFTVSSFFIKELYLKLGFISIGVLVCIYILKLPTKIN